ncbi:DMT family transporter [Rhizomonospora bruguierae]|uniref:DMT family transporter n=1 Tax=Rhizomonospora bruguierae TaxID=1581705 RepID=UPI001BCA9D29|nr:DMT family transporter [Micromonospora sp. NBRC 107566]
MSALSVVAGVPLAVASAGCFGSSGVLQYRATHQVPDRPAGQPALLTDLVRLPSWRWSIVLATAGFGFQVVALRLAPLSLIQPLLVTGVLWYVLLSARVYHRPPDRIIVTGTVLCLAGLTTFLVVADPSAGMRGHHRPAAGLVLFLVLGGMIVACLALSRVMGRKWRSLPLSLAAGICYGLTAGFVRDLSPHLTQGPLAIARQWQTYTICGLGPLGVLLNQNSYQAGWIGAPALAVITVVDPLVSIIFGTVWLGESVRGGTWPIIGESLGLIILAGGVLLLALRAPHVAGTPVPDGHNHPDRPADKSEGATHAG